MIEPREVADAIAARDASARLLGIDLIAVGAGTAQTRLVVRPDMDNGHGVCHGGIIFTLADAAMAYACNSYNETTMATAAAVDFVNPGQVGSTLTATATETVLRGRSGVYDVTVVDDDDTVVAIFRGRVRRVGGQNVPDTEA